MGSGRAALGEEERQFAGDESQRDGGEVEKRPEMLLTVLNDTFCGETKEMETMAKKLDKNQSLLFPRLPPD